MVTNDFDTDTVWNNLSFLLQSVVVRFNQTRKSVLSRNKDLLSAWELELCSSEGFFGMFNTIKAGSYGHEDLSDGYSSGFTETFSESTSHSLLESICTSAGEHLVDSDDVPWMNSDSHMETFSSNIVLHVLVTGDSGCFKGLRSNLLLLVTNQMDTSWEMVILGSLLAYIIDSKFWVWDTSIESGFWIRLVFLVSITP